MADSRAKDLIQWLDDLKTQRRPYEPEWREQVEFIGPNARRVQEFVIAGQRQTMRLYDTTAPDSARKLANYLNGVVTSASTRFQTLITEDPELMRDRDVAIWLDDTSTRMFSAYQQSNFSSCLAQGYGGLVKHGTAAIYVEERERLHAGFNGFRYYTFPIGTWVCSRDADGNINVFMHEFELTAKAALAKFGQMVSESIKRAHERTPFERFRFAHAIYPREGSKSPLAISGCYVELDKQATVKEEGYHEMPVFVADWERDEGELYGKGPGHVALPDIRSVNAAKKLGLEALNLQVRPPLQVPNDGVLGGQVRLTPAAQNMMLSQREILPIQLGHDLKSEMVKSEELREAIRAVFYRDLVALPDKNYMTATEILKNLELINRELGPTLGNVQVGLLKPHAERTFNLMLRAGAFLPPPPSLSGAKLDLQFEGPLARAQRSGDLTSLQQALALVAGIAEHDEEALDNIDTDENVKYIWEVTGTPMRLLRSTASRSQIRQARAEAAQQQAQTEQAATQMQAIEGGARTIKTMQEAMSPAGTA